MRKKWMMSLVLLGFLGACSNSEQRSDAKIRVSLREAWFPWAGYAGEVVAAQAIDSAMNVDFVLDAGAEDIDPIKMVISGKNDFGIASAENLVLSNQKGADLVAIGALNYKSSTCFLTLPGSKITSVQAFQGKRVGVLTGSETETIYRLLVAKNRLNPKLIQEVEAPYDLKSFIAGRDYDVRPAFVYDEPISLATLGIKYNLIKPEDYGVQMMGAVYFTTGKMIKEHPEKVQAFIDVLGKGWERALAEPKHAIKLLKKYDGNINEDRELKSLNAGASYFAGQDGKILFVDDAAWSSLAKDLKSLGRVKASFDIKGSYNNSFVNKFHHAVKN